MRTAGGARPREDERCTVEAYLAFERASAERHEYVAGRVVALAGASRAHNLITANVTRELGNQLKGTPCETYASDMRVRTTPLRYCYPDVVVACGEPAFEDDELDTLLKPTVLVEVLSHSTEHVDRVEKFAEYRAIPTLREYLLVAQDRIHLEHYVRQPDGEWRLHDVDAPDGTIRLAALGATLQVPEVYERVTFPPDRPPPRVIREGGTT
jgi:Uma2 family endonuclease